MKLLSQLIIKVYRIIYSFIPFRLPSYLLALLYVTALHMVAIYGVALLCLEVAPTGIIIGYYHTRYVFGIALVLFAFNYFVTPSFSSIITEKNEGSNYSLILIYTGIDVVLLLFALLMNN